MSRLLSAVLMGVIATAVTAQQPRKRSSPSATIMIAAVSRDKSALMGGLGPSVWTSRGTVAIESFGHLTPSGKWSDLPCSIHTFDIPGGQKRCLEFAHRYLSKPHVYEVVSSNGKGAVVHAAPTNLSECYNYSTTGTYSGVAIRNFAIAASSATYFAESVPPRPLSQAESVTVYKALKALTPKKLDTIKKLSLFEVRLEGHKMIVIQRTFPDVAKETEEDYNLIFGIGNLDKGRFHILYWKHTVVPEQETTLGTIALKNGRQFLVTSVSDPEGHWYRVYGIRAGHLALIYTGGGASC
jgi:hypothetical protein